jgi:hypothetical protein
MPGARLLVACFSKSKTYPREGVCDSALYLASYWGKKLVEAAGIDLALDLYNLL